jgi:glycosyltransferase involved in cell wall biosynthesis
VDLAAVDRFFGTTLGHAGIRLRPLLVRTFRLLRSLPFPLAAFRDAILRRAAQRVGREYELLVTASNEMNFGRPGIQYVHYPWNFRPRPEVELRWYHLRPLLALYYHAVDAISAISPASVRQNLCLVNSDWTGAIVARWYGMPTRTLYPPVAGDFPSVPWAMRANGFVCMGRISPEKELDRVIDIVAGVRRACPDVRLHLVGTAGPRRYYRRVVRRVEANAGWITLHENLSRAELTRLVTSQRYGIHGMREEHFGLAPAEMVVGGSIVWVPAGGGQVEIVARDDRLTYTSVENAVDKIVAVVRDPAAQASLRASLSGSRDRFSTQRFVRELREVVAKFAAEHG